MCIHIYIYIYTHSNMHQAGCELGAAPAKDAAAALAPARM